MSDSDDQSRIEGLLHVKRFGRCLDDSFLNRVGDTILDLFFLVVKDKKARSRRKVTFLLPTQHTITHYFLGQNNTEKSSYFYKC